MRVISGLSLFLFYSSFAFVRCGHGFCAMLQIAIVFMHRYLPVTDFDFMFVFSLPVTSHLSLLTAHRFLVIIFGSNEYLFKVFVIFALLHLVMFLCIFDSAVCLSALMHKMYCAGR